MDPKFLDGTARVPLSSLRSEHLDVDPTTVLVNIIEHLRDPNHIISVRIAPDTRDDILRDLVYTPEQLYATIESRANTVIKEHPVYYAATDADLESAKVALGRDYLCNVRLYCVPVQPRKVSDGIVFQNVRYYMAASWKKNRVSVAQAWMDKLSGPKRKILASLLKHSDVVSAMDSMLCLPGYWEGHQLGNWAKHLAARINPLIINYWTHIKNVAMKIMAGCEDKLHLFDANTVAKLEYRAPSWNSQDRALICELFDNGTLFPGIRSNSVRDRLKDNILSLDVSIPTIKTFHENMKYLTIGAKILEKYIEDRPRESRTGTIAPIRSGLIDNLKNDWNGQNASMEVGHERMVWLSQPSADNAVIQAFIAALRYFPYLSPEAPLRDKDKRVWMAGSFDNAVLGRLCITLKELGFGNKNIEKGCLERPDNKHISYIQPHRRRDWRSGKPCLAGYYILLESSFFPQLFSETTDSSISLEIRVQGDMLRAFFGGKPTLPSLASAVPQPTPMDIETEESTRLDEVLNSWSKDHDNLGTTRRKKGKRPRGIARAATDRKKQGRQKGPKFTFTQQHVPDIPATRTSDLYMGSPVDIMSHLPEGLMPPAKHPNRSIISKRKHDEVNEAEDAVERRKRRLEQVAETPPGKESDENLTETPSYMSGKEHVVEEPVAEPVMRWKRKNPREAPVATPVPKPGTPIPRVLKPTRGVQQPTTASKEAPMPRQEISQNVDDGDGFQIPEIISDDAFSPPNLED